MASLDSGQAGHLVCEPLRDSPAMEGKVGASGSSSHGWSDSTLREFCRLAWTIRKAENMPTGALR
jgi:hypothetical protein